MYDENLEFDYNEDISIPTIELMYNEIKYYRIELEKLKKRKIIFTKKNYYLTIRE